MPGVFLLSPGPVFLDPNQQAVHENATVVASGSTVLTGYGATEVSLFINVKAPPTGTLPTLQYTIQEVDPGDGSTVIGAAVSSTVISAIGIQRITLVSAFGGSIKVSWVVTGAGASFTQVYATLVAKPGSVMLADSGGTAISGTNPLRTDPTGLTTQPVQGVDRTVTGTITAGGQTVAVPVTGDGNVGIGITGVWAATLNFEGTIDGTTWFSMGAFSMGDGAPAVTSTTANGQWRMVSSGCSQLRVRCSAFTSGTATITLQANPTAGLVRASQGAPTSNIANAWPEKITDGTNGPVKVTPASTAAVMADPALVVTMSPNSAALPVTFTVAGTASGVSAGVRILGGATAGTLQKMEATLYTEPTAAAQRSIASSSAADAAAGTGARTVRITYFDGTGAGPFTETVTLNGVTPVNTVSTTMRFIEKMDVMTVGSGLVNAGTISLFVSTGGGGGTIGSIGIGNIVAAVGDNKTWWAHHYVSTGKTAQLSVLVCGIQSGGSGTNGTFFLRGQQPLVANSAEIVLGDAVLTLGAFERSFTFNPSIAGFARVTAYAVPGTNNASITCSFDWSEV